LFFFGTLTATNTAFSALTRFEFNQLFGLVCTTRQLKEYSRREDWKNSDKN
jgi:hypothetical protein